MNAFLFNELNDKFEIYSGTHLVWRNEVVVYVQYTLCSLELVPERSKTAFIAFR